ncbi:MAG: hypothetical protein EOP40_13835 [Rubrivivax sp.]|nr:MAG: hypothetical protein EOP40_13835 [Rubrivivax sp.]
MMRLTLCSCLLALVTLSARVDASGDQGLCRAPEAAFFNCRTANRAYVSLCAPQPKALQYRYGIAGKAFAFPQEVAGSSGRFRIASYARFGVERTEVNFSNSGVDYALFDYTEDGVRRAGVRVVMADGKEKEFLCKGRIDSRLAELKTVLQCDADHALNGGACP